MTPEQKANILEILDRAKDLTVATVREDGYPQATTVSFVHDGLTIYFGCGRDSQKARNIRRSDKISITVDLPYQNWAEIRGLSLGGRAGIVDDPAEIQAVFARMVAKFPQIESYMAEVEAEESLVVRVRPEVISLLDYRQGFAHTEQIPIQ